MSSTWHQLVLLGTVELRRKEKRPGISSGGRRLKEQHEHIGVAKLSEQVVYSGVEPILNNLQRHALLGRQYLICIGWDMQGCKAWCSNQ